MQTDQIDQNRDSLLLDVQRENQELRGEIEELKKLISNLNVKDQPLVRGSHDLDSQFSFRANGRQSNLSNNESRGRKNSFTAERACTPLLKKGSMDDDTRSIQSEKAQKLQPTRNQDTDGGSTFDVTRSAMSSNLALPGTNTTTGNNNTPRSRFYSNTREGLQMDNSFITHSENTPKNWNNTLSRASYSPFSTPQIQSRYGSQERLPRTHAPVEQQQSGVDQELRKSLVGFYAPDKSSSLIKPWNAVIVDQRKIVDQRQNAFNLARKPWNYSDTPIMKMKMEIQPRWRKPKPQIPAVQGPVRGLNIPQLSHFLGMDLLAETTQARNLLNVFIDAHKTLPPKRFEDMVRMFKVGQK